MFSAICMISVVKSRPFRAKIAKITEKISYRLEEDHRQGGQGELECEGLPMPVAGCRQKLPGIDYVASPKTDASLLRISR